MNRFWLLVLLFLLFGCGSPSLRDPGEGDQHSTSQPATIICVVSACDVVLADRAARAAEGITEESELKAKQEADAALEVAP